MTVFPVDVGEVHERLCSKGDGLRKIDAAAQNSDLCDFVGFGKGQRPVHAITEDYVLI